MNIGTHLVAPEEIMALLDGELSPGRARSVSAHLEACPECHQVADWVRGASQSLSGWTVPPALARPEFEGRLSEASRGATSGRPFLVVTQLAAFFRRHWILTAASSALLGGIFLSVSTVSFRTSEVAHWAPLGPYAFKQRVEGRAGVGGGLVSDESKNFSVDNARSNRVDDNDRASRAALAQRLQEEQMASNLAVPQNGLPNQPMIARKVSLSLLVKDFGASRAALDTILDRHHAYAAQLTASTEQDSARSLQASLRIPASELTAAAAELKSLGHVENETQNGEEVTHQHADLVARLKNSRETEQRLQAILLQRTGKVSDVLAVEQEIARVRGEIEQMEAEQKSLEHRVDFATIDLRLAEEYKAQIGSPSPAISTRLHNALVAGYRSAVENVVGIILFFAEYGPSLLVWLIVLFPIAWLLWRRWRRGYAIGASLGA